MNIKDFAQIIIETYKGTIGKGPSSIKVTELDNVLLIDIKGALTPLEYSLLQIAPENKEIIREIRSKILGHVLQKDIEQILKDTHQYDLEIKDYLFGLDYDHDRMLVMIICNKRLGLTNP